MAKGNGKSSLVAEFLHEVSELRTEMHGHIQETEKWVNWTKQRFARMDQNLARMARMIMAVADKLDDHEARLRHLEGR